MFFFIVIKHTWQRPQFNAEDKGGLHHRVLQSVLTAKFPHGEVSLRRNVLTAKCPYGEVSVRRSVRTAKCPYGEMSYGEKFGHGSANVARGVVLGGVS